MKETLENKNRELATTESMTSPNFDAGKNSETRKDVRIVPPAGVMKNMFVRHLGEILNNVSIFGCVLGILMYFSFFVSAFYFCFLLIITLATVGTIFLIIPNFSDWWAFLPKLSEMTTVITNISQWVLAISAGISLVALILLLLDKGNRNKTRIVWSIITLVISVLGFVVSFLNLVG